jgi:hypothetical protein
LSEGEHSILHLFPGGAGREEIYGGDQEKAGTAKCFINDFPIIYMPAFTRVTKDTAHAAVTWLEVKFSHMDNGRGPSGVF